MTSQADPIERLRVAGHAFWTACGEAAVEPTALLLWFVDFYTDLALDKAEAGSTIRELQANGTITFKLVISQAHESVALVGVTADGQDEHILLEFKRASPIPEAVRRAFEKDET